MLFAATLGLLVILAGTYCHLSFVHAMTMPIGTRAAVAQLRSTSDKILNLVVDVAKCAGWASGQQASILFLPECFGFLGEGGHQTLDNAEPPITIEATTGSGSSCDVGRSPLCDVLASTVSSYANIECNQETANSPLSESTLHALRDGKHLYRSYGQAYGPEEHR